MLAWEMLVRCPSNVEVVYYQLSFPGLPGELRGRRLVFVSDVHYRARPGFRELWLAGIVPRLRPDILCLGGDMVESSRGAHYFLNMLESWSAPLGSYFVFGNNELRHQCHQGFAAQLEKRGVRVLQNSHILCGSGGDSWAIAGTDDPARGEEDLERTLRGIPPETFTILLGHSPIIFPEAVERGLPLTLSGHTHGGQVRLPLIGALWTDTSATGLRYQYGLYQEGGSTMVLSKGLGTSKLPIRLLARPEVVCIDLK
jgi:predicted MPP superfamily phosphohydrolase